MMKQVVVREAYDWIFCDEEQHNGLTQIEWDHLLLFLGERYNHENIVEYSNRKLRFINLVGVIQLKTVRIEILPKIDLHVENEMLNRRALLNMLSLTKKLPIEIGDKTLNQYEKVDLLHILASLYIVELTKTLHRGIYREYRLTAENIPTLKGSLLVPDHIRKNVQRTVHAFCEFDELTPNIMENQVLKAAVKVIFPYVQHSSLKINLMNGLELLEDVDDVHIHSTMLDQMVLNRQNKHYEQALQLAIAILQSNSMSSAQNQQIGFAFLFKMNDLFEGYIGEVLKRILFPTSYEVRSQHTAKKLLQNITTGREDILLKPDFVIETSEEVPKVIIDTKWKSAFVNYRRNYKQSDLYQMYAYITTYKTAEHCILLYPKIEEEGLLPKWEVPGSIPQKYIEVETVRLDTFEHTVEDLEGMLSGSLG
ncbi:McrC family protein [Halalkalibacter alkaliphilus]|uniref:McrC family protein n=1 Tax=Halalkalibacter alkaliphilus TaxID=2917993 RepID=A0A9X2CVH6_9BACI|nr:McrC family protein [Halalkalibacter alkaliphilus]MCL7748757.1 McrC family protein [Halalkalibacter alkaliphilus]